MDQRPNQNPNPTPSPPPPPPTLHRTDADDEDENIRQLRECSPLYISLQDCLAESDRNWKSCQTEVLALKACYDRLRKSKRN